MDLSTEIGIYETKTNMNQKRFSLVSFLILVYFIAKSLSRSFYRHRNLVIVKKI